MKIRAAVLREPGKPLSIETLHLSDPKAGEVLVRIVASGVCHSDWHVMTGDTAHPLPAVCGHEGAGVVVKTGGHVKGVSEGDHVVLSWQPSCGACFYCCKGNMNLCEGYKKAIWDGTMLDGTTRLKSEDGKPVFVYSGLGTFADHVVVPGCACVVVPRDVPLVEASLVGCGVATGVGAAFYAADVEPGDSVAVFGCGGVGLNVIQGLVLKGAGKIIAVDVSETKLDMARAFGATHVVKSDDRAVEVLKSLTHGRGVDVAYEVVGLPSLQQTAFKTLRPGATLVLVGLAPMSTSTTFPSSIMTRTDLTIKGSYYGNITPQRDFPLFISLFQSGKLKLSQLVSERIPLEKVQQAFEKMKTGKLARSVIAF